MSFGSWPLHECPKTDPRRKKLNVARASTLSCVEFGNAMEDGGASLNPSSRLVGDSSDKVKWCV
jgi:hypothetical protein